MAISMKAEEIWSKYLSLFNLSHEGIIERATEIAEQIYNEFKENECYKLLLKVTTKEAFVEALVGDFLIGLLNKYHHAHPDLGSGSIKVNEKKLYELGALDPTIISWDPKGEIH